MSCRHKPEAQAKGPGSLRLRFRLVTTLRYFSLNQLSPIRKRSTIIAFSVETILMSPTSHQSLPVLVLLTAILSGPAAPPEKKPHQPESRKPAPRIIGHRGLMFDAPENTLAGFAACLEQRAGFELDIRRSKDGHLVLMHDATVNRTTNGIGRVADLTLAELIKLDAGSWFDPAFAGERVPTLDEVFALLKERIRGSSLVALDIKMNDETLAGDIAKLARKHGVSKQLVCIGLAISDPAIRKALRAADRDISIAVLAQKAEALPTALKDEPADWVYVRFVPTAEQMAEAHKAGKKVFLVGPTVAGREPDNWRSARDAGVDALLTDYPLECRRTWRMRERP